MATGKDSLRLALAQIDTTVGDLDQNAEKIAAWAGRARDEGAELVLFPELCLPGYPAEDLYLKPHFLEANQDVLGELAKRIEGLSALIGFAEPRRTEGENEPRAYNSLALVEGGEVRSVYRKNHLPNYGVFDERRYFEPAS
ncbi:MAG: nitrilase-related carbon-nitrogen hydrolase, partial [Solirubrobacterales bacterium]